jgi:hypothetical protein
MLFELRIGKLDLTNRDRRIEAQTAVVGRPFQRLLAALATMLLNRDAGAGYRLGHPHERLAEPELSGVGRNHSTLRLRTKDLALEPLEFLLQLVVACTERIDSLLLRSQKNGDLVTT